MTRDRAEDQAPEPARKPPKLEAVQRAKLKDQSYAELRRALISGRFEPGGQVVVRHVAELLGAGIMPVREAIQRLIAEGALVALPTGRVHVPLITRAEFEEVMELRLLLEPWSAQKAALRGGAGLYAELMDLQAQIERATAAGDAERMLWANYRFHFAIYACAGSALLSSQIESLWLRSGPMIVRLFAPPGPHLSVLQAATRVHRAVAAAIRAKDGPKARAAMRDAIEGAAALHRRSYPFEGAPTEPEPAAEAPAAGRRRPRRAG